MKTKTSLSGVFSIMLCIILSGLLTSPLKAQWSGDPTINTAVCKQTDTQSGSCAVSDGSDGVIVAWLDTRDSKNRLYAQRLSGAGIPQWTADGVLLCSYDGGKQDPAIVGDGSGGAIVAWRDYRNDSDFPATPEGDIFAQRIDATGTIQWDAIGISLCTAQWDQAFPVAVMDGSGGAIVSWMDGRTGDDHVYAQRINASGAVQWTTDGVAICEMGYYLRYPEIASDGSGGAIITWSDQRVFGAYDIYAQRINASGSVLWTAGGAVVCSSGGMQDNPDIVMDGSGGAVIAWRDTRNSASGESDIYAQRLNANGLAQWTANGTAICTSPGYQTDPAIAMDGTGGAIISWDGYSTFDIYAQRIHGNGNILWQANGVAVCTNGGWQRSPQIIADDFNGAVVVWEDDRNGDWDIYGMRIDGNGNLTWMNNGLYISRALNDQLLQPGNNNQQDNNIVKAGTCGAIVVWNDGRAGNWDIYAQRVYCEGNLGGEAITIDVPNGGESWNVGSTRYIRWHTTDFSGNVDILASYSGNNPQFWIVLASNETNDGTFEWVVPNNPSSNCIIRILDADDGSPYDNSDAAFTITGGGGGSSFIKVDAPDGGENWQIGSQHNIVWHAQNYSGPVRIEYSTDGGASYNTIESSYSGTPPYAWTIPNAATVSGVIKISDPTDADPFDISDAVFTISTGGAGTASITVDVPNGGEDWVAGSKHYIVWHTQHYSGPVNIEYSDDGGASYTAIESSYTGSSSYEWTVPSIPSTNCLMRVAEPSFNNPVDVSNSVFTISAASSSNTQVGDSVYVELDGQHWVMFSEVLVEGNTEITVSPEGPAPPEGYFVYPAHSPLYYDISTTAEYQDMIEVILHYDDASITEEQEGTLVLYVYNEDSGTWEEITTFVADHDDLIGGEINHLTVFAIMMPPEVEEAEGYVVTNTQDSGEGSLRQVLLDAEMDTGVAIITFQIPKTDPGFNADTGVWTIKPQTEFTSISDAHIIIDGMSQSNFIGEDTNPFGPEIQINGGSAGENAEGFLIMRSTVEISYLTINRFSGSGIYMWEVPHAIIAGCYIGTGPRGFKKAGNYVGISANDDCRNINIVPLDTVPNIISGNDNGGISFWDTCTNSLIAGNIIGLNWTRTEAVGGSGTGINFLMCDSNSIVDNWIGGNDDGIGLWECSDNFVASNKIGTDPEWAFDLMNSGDGIEMGHESVRNMIGWNIIGNNSGDGIRINDNKALYNTITENSISMNDSKGINLVNGANGGIAAPIITNVIGNEISGTAVPGSSIEIFTDNDDEGRIIQGIVLSDTAGNWIWIGTLEGSLDSIRATATDDQGNTSEFGKYVPVDDPTAIEETIQPIPFTLSNNNPGQNYPEVNIHFDLPVNTDVRLDVYNLSGLKVAEIHNGKLHAGYHSLTWNTSRHSAGIYLIRMQTRRGAMTNKCVIMK